MLALPHCMANVAMCWARRASCCRIILGYGLHWMTCRAFPASLQPLVSSIGIDLADLRGYHYHSGMVFAAYHAGSHDAIALGRALR